MIGEGLSLMAAGMSVVFCFLVMLVVCLLLLAKFFERFAHLFPEESPEPVKTGGTASPAIDDTPSRVAAAVAAAYRSRQG